MIDLAKANANKEKILSTISTRGPSLPVHLGQAAQISPLFASAFLSELYSEGKVKISNMKVGSSPLYYISGQEPQLERFIDYLNSREKEALHLLKKESLLDDELQTPVIRVALRAVRDFAIPIKITKDGKEKLFWKYYTANIEEAKLKLKTEEIIEPIKQQVQLQTQLQTQLPILSQEEIKPATEANIIIEKLISSNSEITSPAIETSIIEKKIKKKPLSKDLKFVNKIKDYLSSKDIEILEVLEEKKKDFIAKVRVDSIFGKQEYFLIAKDKKKISEQDFVLAHQKAQQDKTLALLISPGELDKKAIEHQKIWKNMIKFEKIKF